MCGLPVRLAWPDRSGSLRAVVTGHAGRRGRATGFGTFRMALNRLCATIGVMRRGLISVALALMASVTLVGCAPGNLTVSVVGRLAGCRGNPSATEVQDVYVAAVRLTPESKRQSILEAVARVVMSNRATKVRPDRSFHLALKSGAYAIAAVPYTKQPPSSNGISVLVEPSEGWKPFDVSIRGAGGVRRITIPAECSPP